MRCRSSTVGVDTSIVDLNLAVLVSFLGEMLSSPAKDAADLWGELFGGFGGIRLSSSSRICGSLLALGNGKTRVHP